MATVVTMLQCYMLHVTLRLNALRPSASRREGEEDRGAALAGGRQEWPWQEGDRDRGADR